MTTSESSNTDSSTRASTTAQSTAQSTSTRGGGDDSDNNSGDDDRDDTSNGPSTGVIVGAVVGSVSAVALIAVAFWLGVRHARRQAVSTVGTGTEPGTVGYRDTMSTAPERVPSVAWTHSPPLNSDPSYNPALHDANHQQYKASTGPTPAAQDSVRMSGMLPPGELSADPLTDPTVYEVSGTERR